MGTCKKLAVTMAVVFAVVGMANVVQAGCGSCGAEKPDHVHKDSCVKCDHSKVCASEDCTDAAHLAACTCPAKKAGCAKCDHAKVCDSASCENAAHDAECTCPPKTTA